MSKRTKCWDCLKMFNGSGSWVTHEGGYILILVCPKCESTKYRRDNV